jgi:hypothetical protein
MMLTSYWVHCPAAGCEWMGSLLPKPAAPADEVTESLTPLVRFRCPSCRAEWHARVLGDDLVEIAVEAGSVS